MRPALWLVILLSGWSVWQSHASLPFLWAGSETRVHAMLPSGGDTRTVTVGADAGSESPTISAGGSVVAYASYATTLVPSDTNGSSDVFVYSAAAMTTVRVSVTSAGNQVDANSTAPHISADGRRVAFTSFSNALAPGDGNPAEDGFVHDLDTGTTTLVTVATDGTPGNGPINITDLSGDGRFVLFETATSSMVADDTNGLQDVFVRDLQSGETTRVSVATSGAQGDGDSRGGTISGDGRFVAFVSQASNFAAGDTGDWDAFVRDRLTGETRLVASGVGETTEAWIAGGGEFVAVTSTGTLTVDDINLVPDVYRVELANGDIRLVSLKANSDNIYEGSSAPRISADGRYVMFSTDADGVVPGDNNHDRDIYRRDMQSGTLEWLSVGLNGTAPVPGAEQGVLSADGMAAAFVSLAANIAPDDSPGIPDVFLRLAIVPPPPTPTVTPAPFSLKLPAVVARSGVGDYPRLSNLTVSANGPSYAPVVDADGSTVAFLSEASNLAPGDTNGVADAFIWQKESSAIRRVSLAADGSQANGPTTRVVITEDGRYVLMLTEAGNLAPGDTNGVADVYRHDLQTGVTEWVSVGLGGAPPDGAVTGAGISADGRWVVFSSQARNITTTPLPANCPGALCETLYRRDMAADVTETWFRDGGGVALSPLQKPSLSADGQSVAFEQIVLIGHQNSPCAPGDVYGPDLYLYRSGTPAPVRFAESWYEENILFDAESCAAASADPQGYIHHDVASDPLLARGVPKVLWTWDTYSATQYNSSSSFSLTTYDPAGGTNERDLFTFYFSSGYVAPGGAARSGVPLPLRSAALSADGARALFAASDLNLDDPRLSSEPYIVSDQNGYTDLYHYDYATQTYLRITDAPDGRLSNGDSREPFMAANGQVAVFASEATNLSPGDTNGVLDVFLWEFVR